MRAAGGQERVRGKMARAGGRPSGGLVRPGAAHPGREAVSASQLVQLHTRRRAGAAMLPALSVCITEKQQMDSAYDLWLKRNQIWTRRTFTEGRYMALFYFMYRDILLIACRQQMVWPLWHHELQHNIVSHCTAQYNLKIDHDFVMLHSCPLSASVLENCFPARSIHPNSFKRILI
ncbi:gastrotropin isoform X3 [Ciconia boyciana]|uniref:gastrotropin isoform X3 n=1 Tax=Ciconia boyciana TaxID=52775 RepID=UPI003BA2E3E9